MRTLKVVSISLVAAVVAITLTFAKDSPIVDKSSTSPVITSEMITDTPAIARDFRTFMTRLPSVDAVTFRANKKYVAGSELRIAPDDWNCAPKGGSYDCTGPEIPAGENIYFAFSSPTDVKLPATFGVEAGYRGKWLIREKITPTLSQGYDVQTDLKDILNLPGGVTAGSSFLASPGSDAYRDGNWGFQVDEKPVERIDPSTLGMGFETGGPIVRDRMFFKMPERMDPDSRITFTYDNPYGDRVVNAQAPDWFFEPLLDPCIPDGIDTCQERIAIGSSICVCGCFAGSFGVNLTLDGEPIPVPTSMSARMISFVPQDLSPGTHVIAWPEKGQSVKFEAIQVAGDIAQDKLRVGQSTGLHFDLIGSEAQLPMAINLNSGGIRIQGGNNQIAFFNGGGANTIDRTVLAIFVGEFTIEYTLGLPPCPCGGYPWPEVLEDDLVTHPWDAEGRANARLIGSDLVLPLTFSSDSIIARTPQPPFESGQDLEVDFGQLSLRASSPGYGGLLFELRSDLRSYASLRDIRVGSDGGFQWGNADLKFRTEFSTPLEKNLPFKIGMDYKLDVDGFEIGGASAGLGNVSFKQSPGTKGSISLSDIQKDAGGKTLFGNADFEFRGQVEVKY